MAKFYGTAIQSNFGTKNLKTIPAAFMGSIKAAAKIVEQEMERLAPKVTGMMIAKCKQQDIILGRSFARINIGWERSDFSYVGLYFYPPAVDLGTGKGRRGGSYIYPKNKSNEFLRFYSTKNDRWISVRRIAGQKAQNVVSRTIVNVTPKILALCGNSIRFVTPRGR